MFKINGLLPLKFVSFSFLEHISDTTGAYAKSIFSLPLSGVLCVPNFPFTVGDFNVASCIVENLLLYGFHTERLEFCVLCLLLCPQIGIHNHKLMGVSVCALARVERHKIAWLIHYKRRSLSYIFLLLNLFLQKA